MLLYFKELIKPFDWQFIKPLNWNRDSLEQKCGLCKIVRATTHLMTKINWTRRSWRAYRTKIINGDWLDSLSSQSLGYGTDKPRL